MDNPNPNNVSPADKTGASVVGSTCDSAGPAGEAPTWQVREGVRVVPSSGFYSAADLDVMSPVVPVSPRQRDILDLPGFRDLCRTFWVGRDDQTRGWWFCVTETWKDMKALEERLYVSADSSYGPDSSVAINLAEGIAHLRRSQKGGGL